MVDENNALMKSNIFKYAYRIYHGVEANIMDSSKNAIYYSVIDYKSRKEHTVVLKYDDRSKTASIDCDCTIQALKSKNKPLCSHIVATIMHAGLQIGRLQNKRRKDVISNEKHI